jgi:hypothetical protein
MKIRVKIPNASGGSYGINSKTRGKRTLKYTILLNKGYCMALISLFYFKRKKNTEMKRRRLSFKLLKEKDKCLFVFVAIADLWKSNVTKK